MIFFILMFYLLRYFAYASSQHHEPIAVKNRSLPLVDALIRSLEREQWKPHDGACLRATLDMLQGVKNNTLWATWMWDSIQLPMSSLYGTQVNMGNYEQCLGAAWSADQTHPGLRSQYCLVELNIPSVEKYNNFGPFNDTDEYYRSRYFVPVFSYLMVGEVSRLQSNQHYMGICLPSICSPSSVASISRHLLQLTHLPAGEVSVDPQDCAAAGEVREYPTGFYVFWLVVLALVGTTIISTFCSDNQKPTALSSLTRSFCIRRNCRNLFTVSSGEVKVIHGLRVITAATIIFIHDGIFVILCPVINSLDNIKFITSRTGLIAMNSGIIVDTFFALSGLLLVTSLMAAKQSNLLQTLAVRYFRLIGPFAFCVFYQTTVAEYMSSGPVWRKNIRMETDNCEKYWWKSLLMANTNVATICHTVSWYISCDFQMAILGTFIFYLFKKNKKLGVLSFVSVAAGLTLNLGLIFYWRQLDVMPISFKSIFLKREYDILNAVYFTSFARSGAYLVGMIMGYVIITFKPAEYRHVINKRWSIIIGTVSLLVGFSMLAVGAIFAGRPYDALESAVVAATNRIFWGVMVCALVAVCEYGSLNKLPSFLGWAGFVPLSKLSYCSYLLHPLLLQLQKFSARTPAVFSALNFAYNGCGVLVLSTVLSLVLHLTLEAPLNNISNKIFADKSKLQKQNGENGQVSNGITERLEQSGQKTKLS